MESLSFKEPIQNGHVFFYDLQTDEVVHFRKDIYDAALENRDGLDIELTKSEQDDAEDAWDIIEDQIGRYEALPPIPESTAKVWEKEFAAAGGKDWEAFLLDKMNEYVLNWMAEFEVPGDVH